MPGRFTNRPRRRFFLIVSLFLHPFPSFGRQTAWSVATFVIQANLSAPQFSCEHLLISNYRHPVGKILSVLHPI